MRKTIASAAAVTTTDGRRHDFRVTRDDYRHCFRGSAYPSCTRR
ncbi:hypothetical protein [Streptomyces sp. NPDC093970]